MRSSLRPSGGEAVAPRAVTVGSCSGCFRLWLCRLITSRLFKFRVKAWFKLGRHARRPKSAARITGAMLPSGEIHLVDPDGALVSSYPPSGARGTSSQVGWTPRLEIVTLLGTRWFGRPHNTVAPQHACGISTACRMCVRKGPIRSHLRSFYRPGELSWRWDMCLLCCACWGRISYESSNPRSLGLEHDVICRKPENLGSSHSWCMEINWRVQRLSSCYCSTLRRGGYCEKTEPSTK